VAEKAQAVFGVMGRSEEVSLTAQKVKKINLETLNYN